MKQLIVFFTLSFLFCTCLSQESKVDSLYVELSKTTIDTIKINTLEKIAKEIYYSDIKQYKKVVDSMLFYSIKTKSIIHKGHSYNAMGRYYQMLGTSDSAIYNYKSAVNIYQKNNRTNDLAVSLGNLGGLYYNVGKSDSAIVYLKEALKINKLINSIEGQFLNYYNLSLAEEINAIEHTMQALKLAESLKNKRFISYCQSQLSVLYMEQNLYDESEKYSKMALKTLTELDDYNFIGHQYVNLGKLYYERDKDNYKAISNYKKAIINYDKIENKREKATTLANIGRSYIRLSILDSAKIYLNKSLLFAEDTEHIQETGRIYANLAELNLKRK